MHEGFMGYNEKGIPSGKILPLSRTNLEPMPTKISELIWGTLYDASDFGTEYFNLFFCFFIY